MSVIELFCAVDDYYQEFEPKWKQFQLSNGLRKRKRKSRLTLSEIMTIAIHFHQSNYRTFKAYYLQHVCMHLSEEFPKLVSYSRFVRLMGQAFVPLTIFLLSQRGRCTGISFIDSTPIRVCHNRRIQRHKVFAGIAARGKSTMGWFYGFKLHLVVNEYGEILSFQLTPGNVDDRKPVPVLLHDLFGKVFADKGYISKSLFEELLEDEIMFITGVRKNMKNMLMPFADKLLLRKRSIIETINDQLKNISQIEHSRHRSFTNFLVNLLAGLLAYCFQEKKPSLHICPTLSAVSA
jgi:Transposase DDE domain